MSKLNDKCERKGLKINLDKTNKMTATGRKENVTVKIRVGDKEVKQVNSAASLRSAIYIWQVAKWLERLTSAQTIDGSSRILES